MTTTPVERQGDLIEGLAESLFMVALPERGGNSWFQASSGTRAAYRRQASTLINQGHLGPILAEYERKVRDRLAEQIEAHVPATRAVMPTRLECEHAKAARGAFESAATIVRGRPCP